MLDVSSEVVTVYRVCVEYDLGKIIQFDLNDWLESGIIGSAVVRLNNEATVDDFELMSVERRTLSSEKRSFRLEIPAELPQDVTGTWEIEKRIAPPNPWRMKKICAMRDSQNLVYVKKTETKKPSSKIWASVERE